MSKPAKRDRDHDIFIKGILTLEHFVKALLYRFLPDTIQKYVDFSTLKLLSETHINNKLLTQYSDRIHECAFRKVQLPPELQNMPDLPSFRFCFLWEHKSAKPNEPIESQVDRYRYAILDDDKKNNRTPSIIIALLIYHGADKWASKLVYDKLAPYLPADLLEYIANPKIIAIDIQAMSPEQIEEMVDLDVLRAAFMALKNAHNEDFFKHRIEEILKFVDDLSPSYLFQSFFKMLLEYMQRRSKLEEEEFNELVEQKIDTNMGTQIKTIFEAAEERAANQTLRKNIAGLMRETRLSDAKIALALGVTEALVKEVRLEFASMTAETPAQTPKNTRTTKPSQPKANKK